MNRRTALVSLGLPLLLAACGRSERLRYKLTLAVDTPDGIKTGFSVVEVIASDVSVPARGTMSDARGEAVYVDLGPGRRPLIAIMSHLGPRIPPGTNSAQWNAIRANRLTWSDGKPDFEHLVARAGGKPTKTGLIDDMERLQSLGRVIELTPDDLPDLVTFRDVAIPASVIAVDPHNLSAALGGRVLWHRMTIEVTRAYVTTGIEKRLPWLADIGSRFLNGKRSSNSDDPASRLQGTAFRKGMRS